MKEGKIKNEDLQAVINVLFTDLMNGDNAERKIANDLKFQATKETLKESIDTMFSQAMSLNDDRLKKKACKYFDVRRKEIDEMIDLFNELLEMTNGKF